MAKTKISEFSSTPANNTDIDSINIAEGCAPSNINDAIRELMAQLKDFQIGSQGDSFNGPIGTSTAAAGAFTTLSASGSVTLSGGTANGVTYLNGSKVLTSGSALVFDGTNFTVGYSSGSSRFNVSNNGVGGFEINPDGTGGGPTLIAYNRITPAYLQMTSQALNFVWQNSGTETMRLTSTGLGIGTSSPATKLHVNGSGDIARFTNGTNNVYFAPDSTGVSIFSGAGQTGSGLYIKSSDNSLQFWTNSSNKATIDSSGNLGLGVTPSAWGSNYKAIQLGAQTALYNAVGYVTSLNTNAYENSSGTLLRIAAGEATRYVQASGAHQWFTAGNGTAGSTISFTQAMTLDASGNLNLGTTSNAGAIRFKVLGAASQYAGYFEYVSSGYGLGISNITNNTSSTAIYFFNTNGAVGSITTNGSATAYNTSSDYRLKNTIAPMTGALAKVALLKPCTYKWNADGSDGEGFIAHELAEVVPQCVTGEKDAVNEDGSIKPQGIDTSFLVATLTAAIQELKAEFDAYKASHP